MTARQRIELRQSEVRQRLNELSGIEDLTDATREKIDTLTTEYRDLDSRFSAAVIADGAPVEEQPAEQREYGALVDGFDMGRLFGAVVDMRQADGIEAELQQELGLQGNQVPLAVLELRAATPAPNDVEGNQRDIIPLVFGESVASFLGIPQPTVGVGEQIFPVMTTGATPGTPIESAVQPESTGAFSADVLRPARIQASFYFTREDSSTFRGMANALRSNLQAALADSLDLQIDLLVD